MLRMAGSRATRMVCRRSPLSQMTRCWSTPSIRRRRRLQPFAKWSPHLYAHNIKTPTLIITNELDFRVPVDQGLQMFTVLRRNGVPSETLVFPDEGHWVLKALNSRAWHEAVFGWMKKYLLTSS